ncbi:DUF6319 family protein [Gordonia hydrophobica]|uniref:DUF6319 family protein n=1 Tax=Gordonia hydrophobica TaxID=40516 RepID=A0ABZ2TY75_9ACTN|nr:DUF6319 family protein [Gordonia hydrophobica]MBM7366541.1 hypothetical protein [Gordonia hydrophobica]
MPPRRRSVSESLTADDLATLTTALADGRRATVYLREGTPSLGLAPGASARVVSIDGTTLTIKPRGVDDELPYEADELRITKTAPPAPEKPKRAAPVRKAVAPKPAAVARTTPPAAPLKAAAPTPPTTTAATTPADKKTAPKKTTTTPARRAGAKKPPASVTVTLFGSSDNEWSVAVARGGRKPARSRSVAPDSVESAMRELGDAATIDATSSILNAAREEAQRRVEELSRELQAARDALAALEGTAE